MVLFSNTFVTELQAGADKLELVSNRQPATCAGQEIRVAEFVCVIVKEGVASRNPSDGPLARLPRVSSMLVIRSVQSLSGLPTSLVG